MIEAKIFKKDGKMISYEISGHAESGEYGHDIVCAAVSVLAITTCNGIEKLTGIAPSVNMSEGYLFMEIREDLPELAREITQILLANFEFALQDVARDYGQYFKISM